MRIQDRQVVTAPCFTMEAKDVKLEPLPVTNIKFNPNDATNATDIKFNPNDATSANGILSPPTTPSTTTPSENDYAPPASGSGRFKFFKDGKFILELWHHKNGERMFWMTVPNKNSTFWPPPGHCTPRQESSTSLSVSDDNSSIQSSPWQRDHCWKQSAPRKNVNRELQFSMHFVRPRKIRFSSQAIRRKRRRPYDPTKFEYEVAKDYNEKIRKDVSRKKNTIGVALRAKKKLNEILERLPERRIYESALSSCRTDPGIVSPRKRILKEMEKVSLDEMGNTKKSRARTASGNISGNTVTVVTGTVPGPTATTTSHVAASTASAKSANNHSITSILSRDEEPSFLRNLLKSPNDTSPEAKGSFTAAESSSNADIRARSTPIASSLSPSYSKNIHCPQPISPFIAPAYLYHPAQPFLTSPSVSSHPHYFAAYPPASFRDPSVWSVTSVSSLPRQSPVCVYPSTSLSTYPPADSPQLIPLAHSSFQRYPVVENGSDVPLNLSKH